MSLLATITTYAASIAAIILNIFILRDIRKSEKHEKTLKKRNGED